MRFFENFNDFPDELLLEIFKYLPINFLPIAQQVCKKWLGILNLGNAKTFRKEQRNFLATLNQYKFTSPGLETKSLTTILQSIYPAIDELIHTKLFDSKEANENLLALMQKILSYYQLNELNINLDDPNAFAINELALKKFFEETLSSEAINDLTMWMEQLPDVNIRIFLKDVLSRIKYLEKIFNKYSLESEKRDKTFLVIANIKLLKDFCSFLEQKNLQSQDNEFTEIIHYQHKYYYANKIHSQHSIFGCLCALLCIGTLAVMIYGISGLTDMKSTKELEKDGYTSSEAIEEHQKQIVKDITLIVTGFVLYCFGYFCVLFMDCCYKDRSAEKLKNYSINYLKDIKPSAENRVEEILDETTPLNP